MRKLFTSVMLVLLLSVYVGAQSQKAPPVLKPANPAVPAAAPEGTPAVEDEDFDIDDDSVIRMSTSLISVPAVVLDRNGRYIPNLRKEDFRIFEDGVEQEVAYFAPVEKPFTVALMLDASGSTQGQLAQLRAAANAFISQLRANDRLLIMTFDGSIHVLAEPTDVSAIRKIKLSFKPRHSPPTEALNTARSQTGSGCLRNILWFVITADARSKSSPRSRAPMSARTAMRICTAVRTVATSIRARTISATSRKPLM